MTEPVNAAPTTPLEETPHPGAASTFTPLEAAADQLDEALTVFPSDPLVQKLQLAPDILAEPLDHLTDRVVQCPACGADADGVDLFCIVCGEFLEAGENPDAATADSPVAPACGDCGAEVAVEEIFCLSCGAVVA